MTGEQLVLSETSEQLKNNVLFLIKKRIGKVFSPKQRHSIKESLEEILEENSEFEELHEDQRAIIRNVLEFNELEVADIMIPRPDIFSIPHDINFEELQAKLLQKTYTRIPVYKRDLDEILGFIHIKDIAKSFFKQEEPKIPDIIRKCLFVPSSMKISNLLVRMQQSHVHIAIVVDEYGGTEGIATLEDILEEIVGKIEDELMLDDKNLFINKIDDNQYEVSSRITIEDINKITFFNLPIQEVEYDTIGGLIFFLTARIPVKGEIIKLDDEIEFEILEADPRRLKRLIIRKKVQQLKNEII
jgi:CBS domain containing-hemolysin-like protein